jgi:hypothetical protein
MIRQQGTGKLALTVAGLGVGALALVSVATTASATAHSAPSAKTPSINATKLPPLVTHTGKGPTGYTVTFRFYDPSARSVQIKGEWYFANPYDLPRLSGTSTTDVVPSPGLLPSQWQPGDVPLAYPDSTAANWPVVTMKKARSGVWSYKTPLPSGTFSYGFFVNCTSATQTGCTEVSDPSNEPYNIKNGKTKGSTEPVSQVYVPSDPRFKSQDFSYQAPTAHGGKLADVTYPAPSSTNPAGSNYLTVYTPPGYDPTRPQKYPTLYALAPDDEVAQATQGTLKNTLDNLIDQGQIQPMVMVSVNVNGFPSDTDSSTLDADIINSVFPYVQSHYDVSQEGSGRAIVSIGNEGAIVNSMLFNHTDQFGYYGAFGFSEKAAFTLPSVADLKGSQYDGLKNVSVMLGGGYEDPHHWYHETEIALLTGDDVTVAPDFVLSGHDWYSWRINEKDFLTRVAFFPQPGTLQTSAPTNS